MSERSRRNRVVTEICTPDVIKVFIVSALYCMQSTFIDAYRWLKDC